MAILRKLPRLKRNENEDAIGTTLEEYMLHLNIVKRFIRWRIECLLDESNYWGVDQATKTDEFDILIAACTMPCIVDAALMDFPMEDTDRFREGSKITILRERDKPVWVETINLEGFYVFDSPV